MATQYFKRNLFLDLYREGGKISLVCFLVLLKREIKKMSDICSLFPSLGDPWLSCLLTLSFPSVNCNCFVALTMRKQKSWNLFHPLSPWHSLGCAKTLLAHDQERWVCHSSLPGEQWWLKLQPQNWHKDRLQPEPPAGDDYSGRRHRCGACWTWTHNLKGWVFTVSWPWKLDTQSS